MNWLTDFVRPKIRAFTSNPKKEVPDDLWTKCPKCEQMVFHRELENNLKICPHCSYHMRLSARERMDQLFDNKNYQILPAPSCLEDPLNFKDLKKYKDRLKEYRDKNHMTDAVLTACGYIQSVRVIVFVMDFGFMGGSMGSFVGQSFRQAVNQAVEQKLPFIAITASGGARMQEGIISLMQMPVTIFAVDQLNQAKLPFITLLTDPTMGGVSASFAMLGDITLAEPGALIGFAGPRIIEQTIKQTLPEGFQTAEFLVDHGMVDLIVDRRNLKEKLSYFASILTERKNTEF